MFYIFLFILLFVLVGTGAISSAMPGKATNEELSLEEQQRLAEAKKRHIADIDELIHRGY